MLNRFSLSLFTASVLLSSCGDRGPDPRVGALEDRIKSLESEVASLHRADTTTRRAMRAVVDLGHFSSDPWDNFLNADEFWENIYDVDKEECWWVCLPPKRRELIKCWDVLDPIERKACENKKKGESMECFQQCRIVSGGFPGGPGGGRPQ